MAKRFTKHERKEYFNKHNLWKYFLKVRHKLAEDEDVQDIKKDKDAEALVHAIINGEEDWPLSEKKPTPVPPPPEFPVHPPPTLYKLPAELNPNIPQDPNFEIPLITKEMFEEKPEISMRKAVEWVFEHLGIDDMKPEDAPTAGAWSMFETYNQNDSRKIEFYSTFASKLLPTRSQLDIEDSRKGKTKDVDEWIDQNLDEVLPTGTEGQEGES